MAERLGLTDGEVAWLKGHRDHATAKTLISLYNMVVSCPSDAGARGLFAAALDEWRAKKDKRDV